LLELIISVYYRMPPQPLCTGDIMFLPRLCSVLSSVCPMPNIFLPLHINTERSLMPFVGGNHHHKQIKWLHFEQNYNRKKGAGY